MVAGLVNVATGGPAQRRARSAATVARALTAVQLGVELLDASPPAALSDPDRTLLIRAIADATDQLTGALATLLQTPRRGVPGG